MTYLIIIFGNWIQFVLEESLEFSENCKKMIIEGEMFRFFFLSGFISTNQYFNYGFSNIINKKYVIVLE